MQIRTAAAALAVLSLTTAAPAQAPATPEFTPEAFKAHVTFLADDLLEGRDAGTRGYDIAARYVATQFEGLGLKPGANGSWYQPVPLVEFKLAEAPATVTIGGKVFRQGQDAFVSATPLDTPNSVEGEAVFVGYGLEAPSLGLNDYTGLDVRGKIVVTIGGRPSGLRSDVGAHLTSSLSHHKRLVAAKHGAIGLISIDTLASLQRTPWEQRRKATLSPDMSWTAPTGQAFTAAPALTHAASVSPEAAAALFQNAPRALRDVLAEAARDGAKPKGFPLVQRAKIERQSQRRTIPSSNVLAVLPGSDPTLANEYVLMMAHLDHEGVKPGKGGDTIYNGAMDNATGIATLIETARAMAKSDKRPRRPILFAAVTAEEDGLLGAQYLAKNPVVGNGRIVSVVNLDMPVLTYDFVDVIAFGAEHSTLGPVVERAGAQMNVKLIADPLPQEGLFARSDHYRFVQEGIPAVFLMTGFGNGGQEKFTNFLATHYHQPSDEVDLPFNWAAGAKFVRLNYLIAREIADANEAPRWYSNSFFGSSFAPSAPKAPAPSK
ncbi:MAG TPA: M20/M25/M40 family metallo-hydrolase [Allosphingosinicella sp.]|uniref:M28 family metallopeptidase n=1 Tax=Allosphingosinicella sp. TaxID=2823234 RepID=UPI002ED85DA6